MAKKILINHDGGPFRRNTKLKKIDFVLMFDKGGLGDHIARMPTVLYATRNWPHVHFHVVTPKFFKPLYEHFMHGIDNHTWHDIHNPPPALNGKPTSFCHNAPHTTLKTHLVDQPFHLLIDTQPKPEDRNYPKFDIPRLDKVDTKKFNLPKKYIVLTTMFTAPARKFRVDIINDIIKWGNNSGYKPVLLGKKDIEERGEKGSYHAYTQDDIKINKTIDLREGTTLLEASKIIANSAAIVGLDNGLLHLAGCTDIPIVMGFTSVDPYHRMPIRNNTLGHNVYPIVPPESLACRFCQSTFHFVFNHDFRKCYYKDYQCVKLLRGEQFIDALNKITIKET